MSGIYGIYRYDGAPVDPEWLDRMKAAMAYYGPHGGGCKVEGPVGMGHLLLEVNPEDAFENQPVRGERGLAVSAARLDNRAALLEAFQITTSDAPRLSDGHLVSLAFDRWGEEALLTPPGRLGAGCLGCAGTPASVGHERLRKCHPLLLRRQRLYSVCIQSQGSAGASRRGQGAGSTTPCPGAGCPGSTMRN